MGVELSKRGSIFFYIFSPITHLLASRLLDENLIEIRSQFPNISPFLDYGVRLPQEWVAYFYISSPSTHNPIVMRLIADNFVKIHS